jgi:hypothetical protein
MAAPVAATSAAAGNNTSGASGWEVSSWAASPFADYGTPVMASAAATAAAVQPVSGTQAPTGTVGAALASPSTKVGWGQNDGSAIGSSSSRSAHEVSHAAAAGVPAKGHSSDPGGGSASAPGQQQVQVQELQQRLDAVERQRLAAEAHVAEVEQQLIQARQQLKDRVCAFDALESDVSARQSEHAHQLQSVVDELSAARSELLDSQTHMEDMQEQVGMAGGHGGMSIGTWAYSCCNIVSITVTAVRTWNAQKP